VKNTFWLFNELYLAINFQSTALKHPSTRLRQRWLVKWDLEFEPSDTQSETRTWSDRKWGFMGKPIHTPIRGFTTNCVAYVIRASKLQCHT